MEHHNVPTQNKWNQNNIKQQQIFTFDGETPHKVSENADFFEQIISTIPCMIRVKSEGKAFIIECSPTINIKSFGPNMRLQINQSDDKQ
jgi:hypothetical protein